MQQRQQATAHAIVWDEDAATWAQADHQIQYSVDRSRHAWLKRQIIAAVWILVAWAVGTIVFELGAIG